MEKITEINTSRQKNDVVYNIFDQLYPCESWRSTFKKVTSKLAYSPFNGLLSRNPVNFFYNSGCCPSGLQNVWRVDLLDLVDGRTWQTGYNDIIFVFVQVNNHLYNEGRKANCYNFSSEPQSPHFLVRFTSKCSSFPMMLICRTSFLEHIHFFTNL